MTKKAVEEIYAISIQQVRVLFNRSFGFLYKLILFEILICLFSPVTLAQDFFLISGSSVKQNSMTREETANLYLGQGGNKENLKPVDSSKKELRDQFYREVTGLSATRVRAYWAKRVFTGRGRPPPVVSPENIEKLIKESPYAVTYINTSLIPDGTKKLLQLIGEDSK